MTLLEIKKQKNQEGITLLLTIMILTAITAIALSIASVALNEIRTSSDITNTEPAITGAEAVAEDLLFQNIRGFNSSCSTSGTQGFANGVQVKYATSYYFPNPYITTLGPSLEQDYYLYSPCNQNSNPAYTNATVQLGPTAGGSVQVNFCSWSNSDCLNNPDLSTQTITAGGQASLALDPTQEYQMILLNNSGITDTYSISITSNDPNVTGIPAGTTTILTTGQKNGLTRKLQTTIPQ